MSDLSKKLSDLYKKYASITNIDQAIEVANQILEINPADYGIKLELIILKTGLSNYKNALNDVIDLKNEYIEFLKTNDSSFENKYLKNKIDYESYFDLYKITFNSMCLYIENQKFEEAEKEACWMLNNDYSDNVGVKNYLATIYFQLNKLDKLNQLINAYKGKSLVIDFYDYYLNLFLQNNADEFFIQLFKRNPYLALIIYGFTKEEDFNAYNMNNIKKGNMQEALNSFESILKGLDKQKQLELLDSFSKKDRKIRLDKLFTHFELIFILILGGLADLNHVTSIKEDELVGYFQTGIKTQEMKEYKMPSLDCLFTKKEIDKGIEKLIEMGVIFIKDDYINLTRQGHYLCLGITTIIATK